MSAATTVVASVIRAFFPLREGFGLVASESDNGGPPEFLPGSMLSESSDASMSDIVGYTKYWEVVIFLVCEFLQFVPVNFLGVNRYWNSA